MERPTQEEIRELADWRPQLGVVSVYLTFDPGDRSAAWRTHLRNGLEAVVAGAEGEEHARRMAVRATAERIAARLDDDQTRPPPHGEAGFVEVAEKGGGERWWPTAAGPDEGASVALTERPLVAPLVELNCGEGAHGVAVVSAERVRLLSFEAGRLEEVSDLELEVTSLDWRERKSGGDPAASHGGSSGHDRYRERLEHNREKFLGEAGRLAAERLGGRGLGDVVVLGPAIDSRPFAAGLEPKGLTALEGGEADLISEPNGKLAECVAEAVARAGVERDRAVVARALGQSGGRPGALGRQDAGEALAEGRVQHLVLDAGIGEEAAEELVRGALASGAEVTVVRGEVAAALAEAEGVAGVLRF